MFRPAQHGQIGPSGHLAVKHAVVDNRDEIASAMEELSALLGAWAKE